MHLNGKFKKRNAFSRPSFILSVYISKLKKVLIQSRYLTIQKYFKKLGKQTERCKWERDRRSIIRKIVWTTQTCMHDDDHNNRREKEREEKTTGFGPIKKISWPTYTKKKSQRFLYIYKEGMRFAPEGYAQRERKCEASFIVTICEKMDTVNVCHTCPCIDIMWEKKEEKARYGVK